MNIGKAAHFLWAALAMLLWGCSKTNLPEPSTPQIADTAEIASFSFGHSGMSRDHIYNYLVVREDGKARLYAKLFMGSTEVEFDVDESVLEDLHAIIQQHTLESWNGFDKSNNNVQDGEGFSLYVTFTDGSEISAYGNNAFPEGYVAAQSDIRTVFENLIDQYGNQYSKTLESDVLDRIMLNLSSRGGKEFFISAYKGSDGMVNLEVRMENFPSVYPEESYNFYGKAKTFPFSEIQSIVRAYDIPTWNGWDKTAENYMEQEWFQMELDYESDERISAMGTLHPENYEAARAEILSVLSQFIKENKPAFISANG